MGRSRKRIYTRRHKKLAFLISEDTSNQLQDPIPHTPKHTIDIFCKTHPRLGYISKFRVPRPSYPISVNFSKRDSKRIASTPTGMRILHIGILAEVLSTLRCNECNDTLYHCIRCIVKQTFFRVKCQRCHSEHATFPFSRSLDTPSHHTCVNVTFNDMNETTMRSALATHSTGMSWRNLHKIATIFDMPPPVQAMPSRYPISLEDVTKSAVKILMSEAADQLHKKVDSEPSPEPKAVNVPISFDSSWKTRGFYSNVGFSAAISTSSKKVLDYEILSVLSGQKRSRKISRPSMRNGWSVISQTGTETTRDLPKQWNRKLPRDFGVAAWRGTIWYIMCLLVTEIRKPFTM